MDFMCTTTVITGKNYIFFSNFIFLTLKQLKSIHGRLIFYSLHPCLFLPFKAEVLLQTFGAVPAQQSTS